MFPPHGSGSRTYVISVSCSMTYRSLSLLTLSLLLSAGVAACSSDEPEEVAFTAEDIARFDAESKEQDLVATASGSLGDSPFLAALPTASGSTENENGIVLDVSMVGTYEAVRQVDDVAPDSYRITNEFLNVRSEPTVRSQIIGRVDRGDMVRVVEFVDAAWAKVTAPQFSGNGYVSTDYIARTVSEDQLAQEKARFDGQYYVNYSYVNLRKERSTDSENLGQVPGQTIVRPMRTEDGWAYIAHDGQEGYVSLDYLRPFLPTLLVRQNRFSLPILHYRLSNGSGTVALMQSHIATLKSEGATFLTLRQFSNLLLEQQGGDVRLDPKSVVIAVSDLDRDNVKQVSDVLVAANVPATFFVRTENLGLAGITERMVLTLLANGFDLESATHTGDDLRSLTNAQAELELQQSRKLLEDITRRRVLAVLYPQGGVNDRIATLTAEAGYLLGVSSQGGHSFTRDELLRLPSERMFGTMSEEELIRLVFE